MKKKTLFGLSVFALVLLITKAGLDYIRAFLQKRLNPTVLKSPYKISDKVKELHQSLIIADLHSDALLWSHNLTKRNSYGHVDIPRLREGNVAIQVFSVVTKAPKFRYDLMIGDDSDQIAHLAKVARWPVWSWFNLTQRALYQAYKLKNVEKRMDGQFSIITSRQELADFLTCRATNPGLVAGILSLEGAHAFEGNLDNIEVLCEAGFRILGLVHFFDNEIGGACMGKNKGGITDFGHKVVRRLEEKGMTIDLAHASSALIKDVLSITSRPVLVTHTGVQGICSNVRNLSDDEIKRVAERGGLIGIGYGPFFNCFPDVKSIVNSIAYVADLVGMDQVALGSDFDGTILAPFDTAGLALLTQELVRSGFTPGEIRKIMGENVVNFLRQNLP